MTEAELPTSPPLTRRGRLQRRLRRQALTAGRDTAIALVLSATLLVALQVTGALDEGAAAAAPADPAGRDVAFSAVMVGDLMFGRHVE